jgi:phage N-6-adenine-methyltransferase
MNIVGFKGRNHPQQIGKRGALDSIDDRGTPPELFDPLNERFGGFTIDVAAAPHNAKCGRFYTIDDNGLRQSWAGESVWCNPPYNAVDLAAFTAKAWREWRRDWFERPDLIVMLVPANRPEQAWWQDHVEPYRDRLDSPLRVEFLRDRRRFIRHDLGHTTVMPNERPPFGVCLLIWSDQAAVFGRTEAPDA